jgi:hypothetical protein
LSFDGVNVFERFSWSFSLYSSSTDKFSLS